MGNEIERATTAFNAIVVRTAGDRVDLEVEGATFATWHPRHVLTGYSWDALSAGCLLRGAGPPASVLVLGLGGGTVVRQLRMLLGTAVRIVGVEIDPGVVELANKHLHLGALAVEAVVADAYAYLATTTDRFDAVIDDLYLTGPDDVMRSRAPAGDTLDLIRARLTDDGVLVANLITDEGGHRHVQRTTRKAFGEAFADVKIVKPPRGLNEILVGGNDVLGKAAWKPYRARFDDEHDRKRWDELVVRSLRINA